MKYDDHIGLVTPQAIVDGITRERRPFVQIPEWILFADISAGAVRVYGVLASFADNLTRFGFPRKAKLAELARMSVSALDRALAELKRIVAVYVFERWRGADPSTGAPSWSVRRDEVHNQRDANGYVLLWNPPAPVDEVVEQPVSPVDVRTPPLNSEGERRTASEVTPHTASGVENYMYRELDPNKPESEGGGPLPHATPPAPRIPLRALRASRLPEDWTPTPAALKWARKFDGSGLDIGGETEKFVNYWLAADGSNAVKRDWDRAWRYWIQRGYEHHIKHRSQQLSRTERWVVSLELGKDNPSPDALRDNGIDPSPWFTADGTLRVPVPAQGAPA